RRVCPLGSSPSKNSSQAKRAGGPAWATRAGSWAPSPVGRVRGGLPDGTGGSAGGVMAFLPGGHAVGTERQVWPVPVCGEDGKPEAQAQRQAGPVPQGEAQRPRCVAQGGGQVSVLGVKGNDFEPQLFEGAP